MGRELLFSVTPDDCIFQTFRSGGKGGQNQNKRDTGVRYIHKYSGAVGESREERSQWQNRQSAWKKMANHPKMQLWIKRESWIRQGLPSPEEMVKKAMASQNIRTEIKVGKKWVVVDNLDELT